MDKTEFKSENQINPKRNTLICVLLAVTILLIYGQVINQKFVLLDDDIYITNNVHVRNGKAQNGLFVLTTSYICIP